MDGRYVLDNRAHAESLARALHQLRESGTRVTSLELGFWLDLLQYRDDERGECTPGFRTLKQKCGIGQGVIAALHDRAEEIGLYTVERYTDRRGRDRLRFNWNLEVLEYVNVDRPVRVSTYLPKYGAGPRPPKGKTEKENERDLLRIHPGTTARSDDDDEATDEKTTITRPAVWYAAMADKAGVHGG